MTHDDLLRRRPVWEAMSDLFLDTETRWSVPHVARRCAASGHDDEALERIFWAEVFPEAIHNLLDIAGEWALLKLDEQALINRANHGSIPWLTRRAHGGLVQASWLATRQVTAWLRELSPEERETRVRALDLLGRRYFEDPARESLVASPIRMKEVMGVAREEWVRYEPVCRAMLMGDERADACSAAVMKLLSV
ncbi:MAG: hypothetical protein Q8N23_25120 [Archangium sp.]|nr:hypothetical protein [Archangium sp.]MDP3155979.1 hypothetical protein [Archangium sp.]MDP3576125.1 hypothetical protein [Archangium sp.]